MELAIPWALVGILLLTMWLTRVREEPRVHHAYTYVYEPYFAPAPKEPWRRGQYADQTMLLPTSVVLEWADPKELRNALRTEREYLDVLCKDVGENGITDPFVAVIDQLGRITLQDGHHRLLVVEELDEPLVPVRFIGSEQIRKYCRPLHDYLFLLLQGKYPRE